MIDQFFKLNILNSKNLNDVTYFTTAFTNEEGYTTPYYGFNDNKFLDKWKYEDFSYTFNKYGFRYLPLKDEADIGAFGCSYTFGQSMPQHRLWHSLLEKNTGKTVLNFGAAGKGIETIINIFCIVTSHIKLKTAIILLPPITRLQILSLKNKQLTHFDFSAQSTDDFSENIFKVLPDEELYKMAKNNLYLAEHIARYRGIKLYFSSWHSQISTMLKHMEFDYAECLPDWVAIPNNPEQDKARDMAHPGPLHHEYWESLIRPYFL